MKSVIKLVAALVFALIATSANAGDERCHDVYSHADAHIVIVDTASRAPGAYHHALRLHVEMPTWTRSTDGRSLWHAKLCFSKELWAEWRTKYAASGMSLCIHADGQSVRCEALAGPQQVEFTCESRRYVFNAPLRLN